MSGENLSAAGEGQLNPTTVAALYVAHGEELRRFLVGVLRDGQLAADVLQVAFARLMERGHETKEESRKAWLYRVAYHEAMLVKRRQAIGDKAVRRAAWQQNGQGESADEVLIRYESVEAVREALDQLRPEERQIVRMRIYEEKKFITIAQELNIPIGTALGRMRTALIKLRERLAGPKGESE